MPNETRSSLRLFLAGLFFLCLLGLGCSTSSGNGGGANNGGSGGSGGSGGTGTTSTSCQQMVPGQSASLGGLLPFPGSNLWNTDISSAPVDANSSSIISNYVGSSTHMHPDFSIEGGSSSTSDRHVLVLDNANCFLYELYNATPGSGGSWNADSTAVWDLLGNEQRPYTWTSADAAGLPIFPGLIRYDEAASGTIKHAFRFTLPHTRAAFTPPASHWAANTSEPQRAADGYACYG
jgi:hypothetical protein